LTPFKKYAILPYVDVEEVSEFLKRLAELPTADLFQGECSVQIRFKLANGQTLRIGVTDSDVAETPDAIWADVVTSV
jgi:hypothetical protein